MHAEIGYYERANEVIEGAKSAGRNLWDLNNLTRLYGSQDRWYFEVCREWVNKPSSPFSEAAAADWIQKFPVTFQKQARLHLRCAAALRDRPAGPDILTDELKALATEFGESFGFVRDLAAELSNKTESNLINSVKVLVPLIIEVPKKARMQDESPETGVLATLTVETVRGGSRDFYRCPELAFVAIQDERFQESLNTARMLAEKTLAKDQDIRWKISRLDGKPLPLAFRGDSAGLAFALGSLKASAG